MGYLGFGPGGLLRNVIGTMLVSVAFLAAAPAAQAATVGVSNVVGPQPDGSVSFTVAGTADGDDSQLQVFSGACQETVPASGQLGATVPRPNGMFDMTLTRTVTQGTNCVYLTSTMPASVRTAALTVPQSLSVTNVSGPDGNGGVSFTASGLTNSAASLRLHGGACQGTLPASGTAIGAVQGVPGGPFNVAFGRTISQTNNCLYLYSGSTIIDSFPLTFTVTGGVTEISVANVRPAGGPAEGGVVSLNLRASANFAQGLLVWLHYGGAPCAPNSSAEQQQDGQLVLLRAPQRSHQVSGLAVTVPVVGQQRFCAYLGDPPVGAIGSQDFTAREAAPPTLALNPSTTSPVEDQTINVVATGSSEVQRKLSLTARRGNGDCAATAAAELAVPAAERVGALTEISRPNGDEAFSVTTPFKPDRAGRWLLCAFISRAEDQAPLARVQRVLDVREPKGTLALDVRPAAAAGQPSAIDATGTVDVTRKLHLFAGPDRVCGPSPLDESQAGGVTALLGPGGRDVGPGAFGVPSQYIAPNGAPVRVCAYVTEFSDDQPVAFRESLFTPPAPAGPPGPKPPGGPTGPGIVPPGVGGPLDIDPGLIPRTIGKRAKGNFWVNNTVLPAGLSAARFVELAKRSGQRWGYKFRGTTSKGAAKRDGRRVIGFSSVVSPRRVGNIIAFQQRLRRPRGCGRSTTGRCRVRHRIVEREIALARRMTTWWDGADHPPAGRMDVETVLLRLFGVLAGNKADRSACSNSPLLRSSGVTTGWWWRSPVDHFRPRCTSSAR